MFCLFFILKCRHVEAGSGCCHLEVKDASISVPKTLSMWNHSVEKVVIQGERGDGSQQPAVPWEHTHSFVTMDCLVWSSQK